MVGNRIEKGDLCEDCQRQEECRRLGFLEGSAAVDKGGGVDLEARVSRSEARQVVETARMVGCGKIESLEKMLGDFPDIDVKTSYDLPID
jgi:hypothetical protein